ncbi:hypothetical protein AAMO2058_001347200 [Amorphochlora amoebiformis]
MPKSNASGKREKGQYQVVRFKAKKKECFEIMVSNGGAAMYRDGKANLESVLFAPVVFRNARKAIPASAAELEGAFGSSDVNHCAHRILTQGDAKQNKKERKESAETRRRQLIDFVNRNYRDARTLLPVPPLRLEGLVVGFRFDESNQLWQEARRLVDHAQKKFNTCLRRVEIEQSLTVDSRLKKAASGILDKFGVSVNARTAKGSKIIFEVGCLESEVEPILRAIENLNSEFSESKSRRGRGSRKQGGRTQGGKRSSAKVEENTVSASTLNPKRRSAKKGNAKRKGRSKREL